jgi:hypothetical protein
VQRQLRHAVEGWLFELVRATVRHDQLHKPVQPPTQGAMLAAQRTWLRLGVQPGRLRTGLPAPGQRELWHREVRLRLAVFAGGDLWLSREGRHAVRHGKARLRLELCTRCRR